MYKSASETAKQLVPILREQGAQMIIAVTHQREPNDNKLAEKIPPGLIDIILGGHDHFYGHSIINSTHVLRSGTDFKQLSYIEAWRKTDGEGWDLSITRRDVTRSIQEHPSSVEMVLKMTAALKSKLEKPIGYSATSLDGRFTTVRKRESNLGNFVCDLMRYYYNTECAIMAAGTIRGDQIYPPGVLRVKDILNCFPFEDPVVVLRLKGRAIREALQNGVSELPALEGRFPQVSNISFKFSLSSPKGSRVSNITVGGASLEDERFYCLATRGYMARGKDGYTSLLPTSEGGEAEELVSEEAGVLISTILRQYFLSLKVLGKWHRFSASMNRHWDTVHQKLHREGLLRSPSYQDSPNKEETQVMSSSASEVFSNGNIKYRAGRRSRKSSADSNRSLPLTRHTEDDEDESLMDSESDSEPELLSRPQTYVTNHALSAEDSDRREFLARQALHKWRRKAGVDHGKVKTVDDAADEKLPPWTRIIAPRLEGRVVEIKEE